jgi:thermolabile hemolysin
MNFTEALRKRAVWRFPRLSSFFPLLALAFCLSATTGRSFTALYVFGDSLSDTGNNPAPAGSYYNGRYSNGALWVEYLSAELGLPYNSTNNFAISGSQTSDLAAQIGGLTGSTNLQSGLFAVLSGGNDFLQNAGLGINDAAWNTVITNAVFNLTNAISQLYTNGAREILWGNLPNLGKTPFLLSISASFASYIGSKVVLFDTAVASAATNVMQRSPGLRIYLVDNFTVLSNVLSAPAVYGFTVTTNDALDDPNLTDKSFNGPGANYVFWDRIHPTTKMHAVTGAAAFSAVGVQLHIAPSGTNFTLSVSNLYPSLPYTIQGSTNLINWTNYIAFTPAATNATMTLTNGPEGKAYYRMAY